MQLQPLPCWLVGFFSLWGLCLGLSRCLGPGECLHSFIHAWGYALDCPYVGWTWAFCSVGFGLGHGPRPRVMPHAPHLACHASQDPKLFFCLTSICSLSLCKHAPWHGSMQGSGRMVGRSTVGGNSRHVTSAHDNLHIQHATPH